MITVNQRPGTKLTGKHGMGDKCLIKVARRLYYGHLLFLSASIVSQETASQFSGHNKNLRA